MAYIWELPDWNSGAKVRRSCWERSHYVYRRDDGTWADFVPASYDGITRVARAALESNDWELFVEPPEEIEVFEWMYLTTSGCWFITDQLMTETETAKYFYGRCNYRKTGRSFKVQVTKKD